MVETLWASNFPSLSLFDVAAVVAVVAVAAAAVVAVAAVADVANAAYIGGCMWVSTGWLFQSK